MYVCEVIVLCTLNLYSVAHWLYFNKTEKKTEIANTYPVSNVFTYNLIQSKLFDHISKFLSAGKHLASGFISKSYEWYEG